MIFVVNDIDIASYADDKTPYIITNNVDALTTSFALASNALFEWFKNNLLESIIDKCHLLFSKNNRASTNTELFLVPIFLYSVRIQENTDQKKLCIWTFFMQSGYKTDKSNTEKY